MATAQELYAQLTGALGLIQQAQNLETIQQPLDEVRALLQQAGTGQYSAELGAAQNALTEFAGAMGQLAQRVGDHIQQTQALMGG
jgi:hypothetical protein